MWNILIVTVLTLVPLTVPAQPEAPDIAIPSSPAGMRLAAFLESFNAGSEDERRRFILEHYVPGEDSAGSFERRMRIFTMLHDELGGLDLWQIEKDSRCVLEVLTKARAPQNEEPWVKLVLEVDSLAPHQLVSISFRPGEDPTEDLPEGRLTDQEVAAYLDDHLSKLADEERFSGAVLVAKDGLAIFRGAYGEASKRYAVPNRIDTKFNLGSMNKMFTGVAIAQLAQQGRLSFNDLIIEHLPDYPNREVAEQVTIHHLLTHTSGMESYWEELFDAEWPQIRTVEQLVELFASKPLRFEPGAGFHYSNAGPVVLGFVIERITGLSYYDYVREHIYSPAGMESTDCYEMDQPIENLAIGYTKRDCEGNRGGEEWRNNLFMHSVRGGPAGGGYSTVDDLLSFANALTRHVLLNKAYTDTVTTGKVSMGPDMRYAYLFGDQRRNGHRIIGHNGGAPGISAVLDIYVDLGYTVAVLANYDGVAEPVARRIGKLLMQE